MSHIGASGKARMVDVSSKPAGVRTARARATVLIRPAVLRLVMQGGFEKGDVLAVARVAGIMAAKKTPELIPLCHPLGLESVAVEFRVFGSNDQTDSAEDPREEPSGLPPAAIEQPMGVRAGIEVLTEVKTTEKTGVEMEALVAASVAALTLYDMCKSADKSISIERVELLEKTGGKSGSWSREGH